MGHRINGRLDSRKSKIEIKKNYNHNFRCLETFSPTLENMARVEKKGEISYMDTVR